MRIVDIHTHGLNGIDTKLAKTSAILEMSRIQGSQGVNAILPAVYPGPVNLMRAQMAAIREAMGIQASHLEYAGSAEILGISLEGPFLNPFCCGALDPSFFLFPSEKHLAAITDGFSDIIRLIAIAPELPGARDIIKKISASGITVSMAHSRATYTEAEEGFMAGARGITHLFNAMSPLHHREPGLAGFGLTHHDVYIEIIADPYHLHRKVIDLIFRMKRPERIIIVSDTVRTSLIPYRGDAVYSEEDHSTLLGGSMTVKEAAEALIGRGYPVDLVMPCITKNPAAYLFVS